MTQKILYVANFDGFFLSHRLPIALEAQKIGYDVIVICEDTGTARIIKENGFRYIELPFKRENKISVLNEVKYILFLYKQYKKIKPDIIHHISIKPVIYGSFAAKLLKNKIGIVNAFSGMGYLFTDSRKKLSELFFLPIFRFLFDQSNLKIILQNNDDIDFFLKKRIVKKSQIVLIKGSGVDLTKFSYSPISELNRDEIRIILPARMLKDKGVFEFYNSAKIIKNKYPHTSFTLCGDVDKANPSSLEKAELEKWNSEGIVNWIGHQTKMAEIISDHHIVVLPSYREGLPKSLIEACAIGRAIITTDTNGCRECVIDNYNGFLVPVKDYQILSDALENLINHPDLIIKYGYNSRKLAEKEFDLKNVVDKTMDIYFNFLNLRNLSN